MGEGPGLFLGAERELGDLETYPLCFRRTQSGAPPPGTHAREGTGGSSLQGRGLVPEPGEGVERWTACEKGKRLAGDSWAEVQTLDFPLVPLESWKGSSRWINALK